MKKKFFNALSVLAIAAVLALNVTVVLDDNATSYLKWDVIGKILADPTSGSGSGYSGWFWTDVVTLVHCGEVNWEKTEYFNEYGILVGTLYIENGDTIL